MDNELSNNGQEEKTKVKRGREFPWFAIILILVGIFLLAQQIGNFTFYNWWALFILIPAFSAFGTAFGIWRKTSRFSFAVWSTFFGGLFPLLVALLFLFNLDWGDYWPLFVILGGFGMLVSGLPFKRPEDTKTPKALLRHRPWSFFFGLSVTLLGVVFLGMNLGWFETTLFTTADRWWAIFIFIPALGGLVTALNMLFHRHSLMLVLINLGGAAVFALVGCVAYFNLDWNLINLALPILLILAGAGLIFGSGDKKRD